MKKSFLYLLVITLFYSCINKDNLLIIGDCEIMEDCEKQFHKGFSLKLNANAKLVLPAEKSILLEENRENLFKYNVLTKSKGWQAETWYREHVGTSRSKYVDNNVVLFSHGTRTFAINIADGSTLYDEYRGGCPTVKYTGFSNNYFTKCEVAYNLATHDIILMGDIQEATAPPELSTPPIGSNGNNESFGRILSLEAFQNEVGDKKLAIRYKVNQFDQLMPDLFSVFNVTQNSWELTNAEITPNNSNVQTILTDNFIYYGTNNNVICVEINTGEIKWVTEASAVASQSMAFGDGDIFLRNLNNKIERRNGETGELVWSKNFGRSIHHFMVVNNRIFCIGPDFVIGDIETGETIESFTNPYINCTPTQRFSSVKEILGFYDEENSHYHIFLNIGDDLISYELAE